MHCFRALLYIVDSVENQVVVGEQRRRDQNSAVLYNRLTTTLNHLSFEFSLSVGIRKSFQTSRIVDHAIILANFAVIIPQDNVSDA